MASLTSTGLGSGLDIEGLVTKLMAVEKAPITALTTKEASYQAQISSYGTLKGSLAAFQTAVQKLSSPTAFNTQQASVADTSVASATATTSATIGTYTLEVTQLAQSQKVKTATAYAATTSTVGSGTLTIDFGTYSGSSFTLNSKKSAQSITISSSQNTLSGVRDAINAAGAGVSASIINDGNGYRLMVTSTDSGTANAVRIQTTGTLSDLAYDASGALSSSMTESQVAKDATFTLDGISVTKSSNTVTDALDGVTLSLKKTNTGSPTTLSVIRDTTSIATSIQGLVTAYNTLKTSLTSLTSYDATTKKAGLLQGDATTRTIQSQLRSIFNNALSFANGGYTTLSDVGISFKKDGTMALDSSKLATSLNDYTKDLSSLFTTVGTPTDSLITYSQGLTTTKPGAYAVNITQLATQGTLTGSAATGSLSITSGVNDTISAVVDGTSVNITLTAGNYTRATLAAELQSKINGALGTSGSAVTVTAGTAASTTGSLDLSTLTYPFSPATGNDSLNVTLGGVTKTISLSGQTFADSAALATGLQTAINASFGSNASSVSVSSGNLLKISGSFGQSGNVAVAADGTSTLLSDIFGTATNAAGTEFSINSNAYGSKSTIALTTSTAVTNIFGSTLASATSYDIAGTIGGTATTGFGQTLTSSEGDAAGLQIKVLGGALGARGTINFDHGFAVKLDDTISDIISSTGSIASRTDGLNDSINKLADRSEVLAARMVDIEKRYRAQFNALDSMLATLQQTSTYLTQQLSALSSNKA